MDASLSADGCFAFEFLRVMTEEKRSAETRQSNGHLHIQHT